MATYNSPASYSSSLPANVLSQASLLPPDLSPSSLDTLPIMTSILTRLQSGLNNPANGIPSNSPAQTQSQSSFVDRNPFSTAPLTTKDIPTATDDLKHRIRKAKAQVAQLPDMSRSIAEQEEEIRKTEAKIAEQRKVLEQLKEFGGRLAQNGLGRVEESMES